MVKYALKIFGKNLQLMLDISLFSMVEIFKKTKVATKNKAVFNKAICANEIKYMGINSIVSNIYRFIEEILYSKTLDEYCNSINASEK